MNEFRGKIGNRTEEERLKKLAEKFVTYFSGTFQCNVGQEVIGSNKDIRYKILIVRAIRFSRLDEI